MLKTFRQLDRASFWKWALVLIAAHVVLGLLVAHGGMSASGTTFVGNIDTVAIIFLATALAGRFRDIGWPVWIGPTFVIVTMAVLPIAIILVVGVGYRRDPLWWISLTSMISAPANLLLVIIAGLVPGKPAVAPEAAVFQ